MRFSKSKARNLKPAASTPRRDSTPPSTAFPVVSAPAIPSGAKPDEPPAPQAHTPAESLSDELIAARAYEIWERRGRPGGESEQDWHAAREELEEERLGWVAPRNEDRNLKPGGSQ